MCGVSVCVFGVDKDDMQWWWLVILVTIVTGDSGGYGNESSYVEDNDIAFSLKWPSDLSHTRQFSCTLPPICPVQYELASAENFQHWLWAQFKNEITSGWAVELPSPKMERIAAALEWPAWFQATVQAPGFWSTRYLGDGSIPVGFLLVGLRLADQPVCNRQID